jgi:thiol-disulfide isomerase/thioredoxin
MKTITYILISLLILVACSVYSPRILAASKVECSPITLPDLRTTAKKLNISKLVFFASWCPACKTHLEDFRTSGEYKDIIFIAAFDERSRAEEAINYLKLTNAHCFFDEKKLISKGLNVEGVPQTVILPSTLSQKQ